MPGAPTDDEPLPARPPRPHGRWQVKLLGGFEVRNGDQPMHYPAERAVRLLFTRLALQPQRAHSRDDLAHALWPELGDPQGTHPGAATPHQRKLLRQALNKLATRLKSVGAPQVQPILGTRDELRLNASAFDIDVQRFEEHARRRRWLAARTEYGGELVPNLRADWLDAERERLATLRARADTEGEGLPDEADAATPPPPAPAFVPVMTGLGSLVGRDAEVQDVRQAVLAHRMVCLTGAPGCGKSRLAEQAICDLRAFENVLVARLEELCSAEQVFDQLRAAADMRPAGGSARRQMMDWLKDRRVLLVLDGFEHLAGEVGDAVLGPLLDELPLPHVLVTSRRARLRSDEHTMAVNPLPLPDEHAGLDQARRNPSVALFVARAHAVRDGFTLNARNLRQVIDICQLLEGLPLSVELAAAQVRGTRLPDMVAALRHGIKLAARPQMRNRLSGRHASLEAALEWSWQLLHEEERDMLRRLCVFRGGWTLAQAQAAALGQPAAALLDTLMCNSLLRALPGPAVPQRLGMLAVVREFVESRCTADALRGLRQQHRALFLAQARQLEAQREWPADEDQANLAQVLATACDDDDIDCAFSLADVLAAPWRARGAPAPVPALLQQLVEREELPAARRAPLAMLLSSMLVSATQGRLAHAQAGRALALAGDEPLLRSEALLVQADVHLRAPRDQADAELALPLVLQARALLDALPPATAGADRLRGRLLLILGPLTLEQLEDVAGAAALFEQAERIFSVLGDRRAAVLALPGRTACLLAEKRYHEAIAVARKGDQETAELGDVLTRLQLFDRVCSAHDCMGQYEAALLACQRQARLALRHGLSYYGAFAAWNQCHPLVQLNQAALAARLMAFSWQHWVASVGEIEGKDRVYADRVNELALALLGERAWRIEQERGRALGARAALELAAGPTPGAGEANTPGP